MVWYLRNRICIYLLASILAVELGQNVIILYDVAISSILYTMDFWVYTFRVRLRDIYLWVRNSGVLHARAVL